MRPLAKGLLVYFQAVAPTGSCCSCAGSSYMILEDDAGLTEGEQELFGKRPLEEKSRGYGGLAWFSPWAVESVWTFGLFRCIVGERSEDEG